MNKWPNCGHMVEVEMIACPKCNKLSGDDWSQCKGSCPMKGEVEMSDEAGKIELIPLTKREADIANMRYVEGWNAAIEAAAKVSEEYRDDVAPYEIRNLKK